MVQFDCPKCRNSCFSITVGWIPFSNFQPLLLPLSGVIRKGSPSIKIRKVEQFWNKISSTGCKWSTLNAPITETPVSHSLMSEFLFPIISPMPLPYPTIWRRADRSIAVKILFLNLESFGSSSLVISQPLNLKPNWKSRHRPQPDSRSQCTTHLAWSEFKGLEDMQMELSWSLAASKQK